MPHLLRIRRGTAAPTKLPALQRQYEAIPYRHNEHPVGTNLNARTRNLNAKRAAPAIDDASVSNSAAWSITAAHG